MVFCIFMSKTRFAPHGMDRSMGFRSGTEPAENLVLMGGAG